MNRTILVLLLIVVAVPAAAQSRSESFSTRYDSGLDAYTWEATYEFEIPPYTRDRSIQNVLASEVIVDLYWNTSRVWLLQARIECWSESSGSWLLYADRVSDHHFMNLRTAVFSDECRLRLLFVNSVDDRYQNSSQRAAVRVNVSSTTGGNLRLTKTRNPLGIGSAEGYANVSQSDRKVLRDRIGALKAALAEQ